jgi:hypothetical protein
MLIITLKLLVHQPREIQSARIITVPQTAIQHATCQDFKLLLAALWHKLIRAVLQNTRLEVVSLIKSSFLILGLHCWNISAVWYIIHCIRTFEELYSVLLYHLDAVLRPENLTFTLIFTPYKDVL